MKGKIAILCAAVAVLALVHLFVMPLDRLFLFLISERSQCGPNDADCFARLESVRGNCNPSVSIVTVGNATNNVTIRVTTFMRDGKCVTEEIVLDDSNSGIAPFDIAGYNTTCDVPIEKLEEFGQKACNGSLLSYISPGGKPPSGGGTVEEEDGGYVYKAYCSLEAQDCKETAAEYVKTCGESEITMDLDINHTQGGVSYWTIFIDVERLPVEYTDTGKLPARCSIYHELINAVNLPPEIPPGIIGMNMTCIVPLSRFPIGGVSVTSCEGDLVEYMRIIYP
jgi:hypothetical protein